MKFQVGDRVRVVKKAKESTASHKTDYIGKVFTITRIHYNHHTYPYDLGGTAYSWCDEELELAQCIKSDLKDGMVVEYRNCDRRMVVGDIVIGREGHRRLTLYNDTLECDASEFVIDRIYTPIYTLQNYNLTTYFDDKNLELIWERPKEEPVKEMTVEEIEKELGYKVKIVADDKN